MVHGGSCLGKLELADKPSNSVVPNQLQQVDMLVLCLRIAYQVIHDGALLLLEPLSSRSTVALA